jgi:hypothetical protein
MALSKAEKKKLCVGCRDNRYNMGVGYQESSVDAAVTCKECWSLASATLTDKMVYYSVNDVKPTLRTRTLSCWHKQL